MNVVWFSQDVPNSLLLLPVNIHCTYVIPLSFEDEFALIHTTLHYYCTVMQYFNGTGKELLHCINDDESEVTNTYKPCQDTSYFCFQWSVL